jgi:hypothetical protein
VPKKKNRIVSVELSRRDYYGIVGDKYTEYVRLLNAASIPAKQIKILETSEKKIGFVTARIEIVEC